MKKFLFFFAVTGWILAATAHLLSLADYDVREQIPFIWILHIGIFVVWIPMILNIRNNEELIELRLSGKSYAIPAALLRNTPNWMKIIAVLGFPYTLFNFAFFLFNQPGTPEIRNGQF